MTPGVQALDWALLSPVVVLVAAMLAVLVVDAVVPGRRRVLDAVALAGPVGAAVALTAVAAGRDLPQSTLCVGVTGDGSGICSFSVSGLTVALQAVTLLAAVVTLLLALDGPGARARGEHHALMLAATAGALALAGARDLATMVVALETATLPVVGLIALRRDARGAEAALKLLLVAVASLGVLLLGVALLYAGTGALHLSLLSGADPAGGARSLVLLGLALVLAGAAFKLSAMPFGWWTPDVYAGSPPPVAAFLSTVSKAAATAFVVVVLVVGVPLLTTAWAPLLGWLAAITMTVGNLVALRQRVAVRLLAWSTVAQAGWVLLPLAGATAGLAQAARASVGYLLAYVVASLAAFVVVVLVARHHPDGERHLLADHRGLVRREPVAAAALGFALACLAGLPPGVMGLVAKVVALRPVVDAQAWVLAVVAAVNVALGLAYYLRWAALLVAREPHPAPVPSASVTTRTRHRLVTWDVTTAEGLALGIAAGACVVLSVLPALVAGVFGGAPG
jgi:NADH-quinone oxidoreductase subunit N